MTACRNFSPDAFAWSFARKNTRDPENNNNEKKLKENKKNIIELVRATQLETTFCS